MIIRIVVWLAVLLPGVAMAQEADRYVPVAEMLLLKAQQCEANWSSQQAQFRGAIAAQQKQIEALTKERDDLKTKQEAKP